MPFVGYVKKYDRTRQAADKNTVHAICMLDEEGYKHTQHRKYLLFSTASTVAVENTYCFSTATVVAGTSLNVTSHVHCLSC
jgi:hypothetical protein